MMALLWQFSSRHMLWMSPAGGCRFCGALFKASEQSPATELGLQDQSMILRQEASMIAALHELAICLIYPRVMMM
jgi:hypothetical protein